MNAQYILGQEGEQLACEFIEKNGYQILEKNYRFRQEEIDIIAHKKDIIAIIEVKTRSTNAFGNPETFVSRQKQKHLMSAANEYIQRKNIDLEVRFDIISILKKGTEFSITHFEDAFSF